MDQDRDNKSPDERLVFVIEKVEALRPGYELAHSCVRCIADIYLSC